MMSGEEVGGGTAMEKQSLADVEFLWNVWEVHVLILASLFLQVFLFLFADMRRRSTSRILRTVLWLAYLSADSVAIFELGHLAVRASKSGHHLMHFWAPFVLVHLGAQDTITAFSKQDNELWNRHLLTLVTQVAMAGYVVAKASWPDRRLRAAMVIMFLSGCFKYAERTLCLFVASPDSLKYFSVTRQWSFLERSQYSQLIPKAARAWKDGEMWKGSPTFWTFRKLGSFKVRAHRVGIFDDILSADPPLNDRMHSFISEDNRNHMLKDFLSNDNRHRAYEYVDALLVHCYRSLYTKFRFRLYVINACVDFIRNLQHLTQHLTYSRIQTLLLGSLLLLYVSFHYVSAPIALVLFWAAEKDQPHTASRADITVSYILLVGALMLDVSSAILFLLEYMSIIPGKAGRCRSAILRVANKMKLLCHCEKESSQEIHQYNMIENRDFSPAMSRNKLCASYVEFRTVGSISIPKDGKSPIQEFILDYLLSSGTRKEWNIASSRGKLAIEKWWDSHQDPDSARTTRNALEDSIIRWDFSTSVLIWHIATDMCYYYYVGDKTSTDPEIEKHEQISRQLSNYIMYLICKCGVTLTVNFQIVLETTRDEIRAVIRKIETTEDVVRKLFEASGKEDSVVIETQKVEEQANEASGKEDSTVIEIQKVEEQANEASGKEDSAVIEIQKVEEQANEASGKEDSAVIEIQKVEEQANEASGKEDSAVIEIQKVEEQANEASGKEDSAVIEIQKHEEQANDNNAATMLELQERAQAKMLCPAYKVAQQLISIKDESDRWRLIVSVWAEMLYYIAPRCGASFHYEHLNTGGEFITHVLLLMYCLGPFLPSTAKGAGAL